MPFTPQSGVIAQVRSALIAPVSGVALVAPTGSEAKTAMLGFTEFTITPQLTGGEIVAAGCPADAQGNIAARQTRGGVVRIKVNLKGVYDGDAVAGASSDARFAVGAFLVVDMIYNSVTGWGRYGCVGRVASPVTNTKVGPDTAGVSVDIDVDGFLPAPSTS